MIGWLLMMMALAAWGQARGPTQSEPVLLDHGVTVSPAPGWAPATGYETDEANQTAFRRAGTVAIFAADLYDGDSRTLLDEQLAELDSQFSPFRTLPPGSVTVAGDVPALRVLFDGMSGGAELEGWVVAASSDGVGVVMVAFAPFGQLHRVQGDLNRMLRELVMP